MYELRDLYQEVIIDHNRCPRNFHDMDDSSVSAEGFNPLCGDRLTLYLKIEDGIIEAASFQGCGCAISTASASLMTEALIGKSEQQAEQLFHQFHNMVTKSDEQAEKKIGKLAVLAGVKAFPARVKCATLAWHTLQSAMHENKQVVSTE